MPPLTWFGRGRPHRPKPIGLRYTTVLQFNCHHCLLCQRFPTRRLPGGALKTVMKAYGLRRSMTSSTCQRPKFLMKFTYFADVPKDDLPYPLPCLPLRFSYVSRPELLGTPEMDKKELEDSTLSKLIIDRDLWNTYQSRFEHPSCPAPPGDDSATV